MLLNTRLLIIYIFFVQLLWGQQNTVSAGGNASGSSGSISYTIGQLDYQHFSSSNEEINLGVQQPIEIFASNAIQELSINLFLSLSPNPSQDIVKLSSSSVLEGMEYYLINAEGKLIIKPHSLLESNFIDLSSLSSGEYFVVTEFQKKPYQTFKLIKH